ncbi:MAG: nucleotide exchange factor GrpE [Pseudomonadales bacterium]|nr:nucleotide exchange factor GrpE [Pseudomonadales bacterium]
MSEDQSTNNSEENLQQDPAEQPAESPGTTPDAEAQANTNANGEGLDSVEIMQARIETLEQQLTDTKDQTLRTQAEMQNIRRRSLADVEKAHKFALDKFSAELLPVIDNLERALETITPDEESTKTIEEGITLTLKSFLDVIAKFDITVIDPAGEPFDPQVHQAMSMIENKEVEPNTVLHVVQKGYSLNGRVIRPAMVMVSKN